MSAAALELVEKTCTRCGETKPGSEFTRRRRATGSWALQSHCKSCNTVGVREAQERRRTELGEEEYQRVQREAQRRSRVKRGNGYDVTYRRVYDKAARALIDAHRREFEELLRRAKYEAGL